MKTRLLILTSIILVLNACMRIESYVNSIIDPKINVMSRPYTKYLMMPLLEGVDPETDLQYREYEQILDQILNAQGFVKSPNLEEAGIVVFVAYGIGDPRQQNYTMALPVWGQTGVSSAATSGTINLYKNYGTYTSHTTYTPSYGITGYVPVSYSRASYTRFLFLEAIDLSKYKTTQKIVPSWKTSVISTGSTGDLRVVFPYLARAAAPYLVKDSGKAVRVVVEMKKRR